MSLEDAVVAARRRYADRHPLSAARHARAARWLPGGNTRSILHVEPFPVAFERGEGPYLWSVDGHQYADFLGEFTAGLYGHSEKVVLDAVRDALDRGLSFGGVNDLEPRLAELVCARFPSVELVRFTNSGTEANLMALALAVATTGRPEVLVFRGGYHGGVLTFGQEPSPVTVPHAWVLADYDDVDGTRALVRAHAGTLAAVLVEPMLGAGGCVPASQAFLEMLREETAAAGAVLVFDEVMTSRLSPGGLQQATGVTPDLTTLGKYLGGGLTFGAFGGRADLMAAFDPTRPDALFHAGTFNNNVLTLAAGIAGLEHVLDDATLADVNERGDRLRAALDDVARPAGLHVTGRGSMMTIHAGLPPYAVAQPPTPAGALAQELVFLGLVERGYWLARRGMVTVSLPIADTLCDGLVAAFADVVRTYDGELSELR
ncbi:aminotransferase class III-fold pyridoxal phosphate-dependent enzyme [Nocardioides anomalus]|uniref:Aminotransferase class III-fold pyridoxal phosphate-dependent enzyme n=1 Tax=Nocardioides anomalus TaxID=2712223 RepID=A0A6G6WAP6_9ACTN|nr:aminotransferase class III-fold pyridoxal phosphate-dependent enzyme [Nocardioides anomalus]QIG42110.1 aminotransferase class III-fold pyridoxal phosphate-dependent enzyme [Nocardioides anomalus]